MIRVLEQDERPEEAVPRALELEDRDGREGRAGERQHHPPERREEARAVDPGRLLDLRGIDRKYWRIRKMLVAEMARTRTTPMYWPRPRVRPSVVEDQVDGHEAELVRDHQRREDDQEQDLAAGEPEPGEGVAGDARRGRGS